MWENLLYTHASHVTLIRSRRIFHSFVIFSPSFSPSLAHFHSPAPNFFSLLSLHHRPRFGCRCPVSFYCRSIKLEISHLTFEGCERWHGKRETLNKWLCSGVREWGGDKGGVGAKRGRRIDEVSGAGR